MLPILVQELKEMGIGTIKQEQGNVALQAV